LEEEIIHFNSTTSNIMKTRLLILLTIPLLMGVCKAQNNVNLFGANINYQSGTILLTSINTVLTTLNASGINPKWQSQYTHGLAVVTGAAQLAYGIYQAGSKFGTLDIVNITAGAATMITNAVLLYKNYYAGGKKTTWNIYYSPFDTKGPELGLRIVQHING
jgi:hypothetical protein